MYIDPDLVLFAYHISRQDYSKYTPFYLMYMVGKPCTLPIDILSDQRKTTSTNSEVQITDKQILEKSTVDKASLTLENSAKKDEEEADTKLCLAQ